MKNSILKNHGLSLALLVSLIAGSLLGLVMGENARVIKPLGDIFLNLLFTIVVPLVFFSISSVVAGLNNTRRLGSILGVMLVIFIMTGFIASLLMIAGIFIFNPAQGLMIQLSPAETEQASIADKMVRAFTVSDFGELLSRKNMLALIVIAMLTGLAASQSGARGEHFRQWLSSANAVMMRVVKLIMLYAPVGLGAYFAYLVGVFGKDLLGTYARVMALYYPLAFGYYFFGFSFYAYLAAGIAGFKSFWGNIIPASLTALGTGSSVATIPSNLEAAKRIGIPEDIREVIIPIGSSIHMDGSCLAAILKIAVLFHVFGMEFTGFPTLLTAIGISILCGVVMGGIPGGGFLGELLIVSLYGFPPEALPIAAMIGTLVDPPATMVNAAGDNAASMLAARILGGRHWMNNNE